MEKHYSVNVIGVVLLFQAMRPMIEKSERGKFITMSSSGGSITQTDTLLVSLFLLQFFSCVMELDVEKPELTDIH